MEVLLQNIAIVGGGVVGLSVAVTLARAGHPITLIDDDPDRGAASWGNAGHLAVEQVAPLASPASIRSAWRRRFAAGGALHLPLGATRHWLPFVPRFLAASRPARFRAGSAALAALLGEAMPAWHRLADALGRPDLVRQDGHLVVWESARTAAAGEAAWRAADTGAASLRTADPADLARIGALTTVPVAGALRFEGSGQIADLNALADALEATLRANGGRIVRDRAVLTRAGRVAAVGGHDADLVVVAAGARSAPLLRPFGHRVPIVAERGYHIRAQADRWPADLPPVVFEDRSTIVTRYADTVQAASFVEFGGVDDPPDPRKWDRLERHVADLGLPVSPPFRRWMGARPTLPDYLPAIGRSAHADNLFYAFGHQHLGLTLAAVTAERIAALVAGETRAATPDPFDLDRFGGTR